MNRVILHKEYSDESVYDMERDVSELFESKEYSLVPSDKKSGFKRGKFALTVIWHDEKKQPK